MVNPHDILNNIHEDPEEKSADDFADMLIGDEEQNPAKKAHARNTVKKALKKAKKSTQKSAKESEDGESEEQLMGSGLPRAHHAEKKTTNNKATNKKATNKAVKEESAKKRTSSFSAHKSTKKVIKHESDDDVTVADVLEVGGDDEMEEVPAAPEHRALSGASLQGMASKFIEASEEKDHSSAKEKAEAGALAKEKVEQEQKEKDAEVKAAGGHVVHLNLDADDVDDQAAVAPKEEDHQADMENMLSIGDDDDDDDME